MGEQDYAIYKETAIPYIGKEGEDDLSLQIFEEVCMMDQEENPQIRTFGLGYSPTQAEIREMKAKIRRRKIDKTYDSSIEIPHIKISFPKPSHVQHPATNAKNAPDLPSSKKKLTNWFSFPCNSLNSFE